jgi:hypothetical protein
MTILAPPATYTVKLSVNGRDLTQPLTVMKDPHSGGSDADIKAQIAVLFELRRDIETGASVVNEIEFVRGQIANLGQVVQDAAIKKGGEELDKKLIAVEGIFLELRLTGRGDGTRWGSKLLGKMNYLAGGLASADFKPTDQQMQVKQLIEEQLKTAQSQAGDLLSRDLSAFNEVLRKANAPIIVAHPPATMTTQ